MPRRASECSISRTCLIVRRCRFGVTASSALRACTIWQLAQRFQLGEGVDDDCFFCCRFIPLVSGAFKFTAPADSPRLRALGGRPGVGASPLNFAPLTLITQSRLSSPRTRSTYSRVHGFPLATCSVSATSSATAAASISFAPRTRFGSHLVGEAVNRSTAAALALYVHADANLCTVSILLFLTCTRMKAARSPLDLQYLCMT